jgi:hypothetical protein
MLSVADDVSHLLAETIASVSINAAREDRTARELRVHALWFMAIIALRALRAAMQTLGSGYEDQSIGYQRLIDELHNRAQKVHGDSSGIYARDWLDGRNLGKGAKLAGQDFWEFLSGPVHANVRGVLDWIAVSQDDGSARIMVGPERRSDLANAALTYMASEGRDLANLLGIEAELKLDLATLDPVIRAAVAKWIPGGERG